MKLCLPLSVIFFSNEFLLAIFNPITHFFFFKSSQILFKRWFGVMHSKHYCLSSSNLLTEFQHLFLPFSIKEDSLQSLALFKFHQNSSKKLVSLKISFVHDLMKDFGLVWFDTSLVKGLGSLLGCCRPLKFCSLFSWYKCSLGHLRYLPLSFSINVRVNF